MRQGASLTLQSEAGFGVSLHPVYKLEFQELPFGSLAPKGERRKKQ